MKKRKVLLIIVFLLVSMFLTGCDFFKNSGADGKEYNIVYINGTTSLSLEPSKYTSGVEIDLPVYEELGFVGWYKTKDFSGDMYTKIEANETGQKIFYARIEIDSYTITYMDGDDKLTLAPANYLEGTSVDLPIYTKNGYSFKGWYASSDLSGNAIAKINTTDKGNKTYYAKFEEISKLSELLNNMNSYNYSYEYECTEIDDYNLIEGKYSDNTWQFNGYDDNENAYCDYVTIDENNEKLYYFDNGNDYELLKQGDDYYDNIDAFPFIDLSVINDNDFDYINDYYKLKSDKVSTVIKDVLGEYEDETYIELLIYSDGTKITKLLAKSIYNDSGDKYNYVYTIEFSNINSTTITLPIIKEVEVTEVGISASPSYLSVLRGVTEEQIKDRITVVINYSDSSTKTLDKADWKVTSNYNSSALGSYSYKIEYNNYKTEVKIDVLETVDATVVLDDTVVILSDAIKTMGEYDGVVYGVTRGLPTTNPKALVLPVEFTDYKASSEMTSVLEKAFFGTSTDTGWESLQSYYNKASYGKTNITGEILPVFNTGKSSKQYEQMNDDSAVAEIIKNALTKYDSQINYKDYDSDSDGYIDAIYIIYTAPVNNDDDDSLYWAFTYEYYTDDYEYYDEVEACFYTFLGYDFFFEALASEEEVKYNCETLIHESGHLFGLDDYYDYDEAKGEDGGIGGGDMMDYNVGDHNPYSKIILGWVTPTVIDSAKLTKDISISLKSFGSTGECIVICNGWNNTYFDEYYVIDFYTPDGLNAIEAGSSGLFNTYGIRIYHVDARLKDPKDGNGIWELTQYNNSDTAHKLIKLIQADGLNEIEKKNGYGDDEDLFLASSTYTNIKWYNNSQASFSIKINSITQTTANITIVYNK